LLQIEALHNYTSKLPLLGGEPTAFYGTSTNQSIHSGVVNALVYEIDGFIGEYKELSSNFIIILTGRRRILAKRLKYHIQFSK
jgi:type III pantothenate kinase